MWLCCSLRVTALLFAALPSGFSSHESTGTEFVTAFLENMAYYHPSPPTHRLLISALYNRTQVNVTIKEMDFDTSRVLWVGQTEEVALPRWVELGRSNVSSRTVHVSSSSPVAVLSVNAKGSSIETSVVQPVQNLGTEYFVASLATPTASSYRIVIINTQSANTVKVSHSSSAPPVAVTLGPYQNAQFQIEPPPTATRVTADHPVAVLFGHPCIDRTECTCGLVFEQLSPTGSWGTLFIVPPSSSWNNTNQLLLLTASESTNLEGVLPSMPFSGSQSSLNSQEVLQLNLAPAGSPFHIKASRPVSLMLLNPGLTSFTPEETFSSCHLLHALSGFSNYALLVVRTAHTDGVGLGEELLPASVTWTQVDGTEYSQALVPLGSEPMQRVVWHKDSKIGVYNFGENTNGTKSYGHPALSLKVEPDGSKCKVGVFELVQEEKSWSDALQHCWAASSQLVSISSPEIQQRVAQALGEARNSSMAWMGLRRSLLSGAWRWLSRDPVGFSRWAGGEPGDPLQNQCAAMLLEPERNFIWTAKSCCQTLPFICFQSGSEVPFP
ncbi:hypothetical protein MATL_G00133200 [Megalops atlanticus]|uniref:C-type lectin domain-containing protein n=1 Tax=Megalops atlanticus TaxID=7932 RepID=A0A9D3PYE3_MEGAT|nr:hypothetical protein MATL_G00133200 [Megalops atlanticus]